MGFGIKTELNSILKLGVDEGASDWHIKENAPVNIRIHGAIMRSDFETSTAFLNQVLSKMLVPEQIEEFAANGDLDISFVEENVGRFRVNIHRQRGMIAMTLRYVKAKIPEISDSNLPPVLMDIASQHRGIILVTGTTGSGKSTTLAAMLQHINKTSSKHIITVEDPIEFEFQDLESMFEQREVGLDTITFETALISAMRQDPDVIMIGEMRDRESFEAALRAADTGHLVFSTLHSANAAQTISRILDFYTQDEQRALRESLARNLTAIISQRLIPAVAGGVLPAVEVLIASGVIRKLIQENKLERIPVAIEGGENEGMQSFNRALLNMVNAGLVSEEVAMENSSNPETLRMNLQGIFLDSDRSIIG